MSKVTNKQIADVFRAARLLLDSGGQYRFICNTIRDLVVADQVQRHLATDIITSRLRGCYTVEDWLHREGVASYSKTVDSDNTYYYRLAWLDSLIEEFNKPGYYKQ